MKRTLNLAAVAALTLLFGCFAQEVDKTQASGPAIVTVGNPDLGPAPDLTPPAPKPDLADPLTLSCNGMETQNFSVTCPNFDGTNSACALADPTGNPCEMDCGNTRYTRVADETVNLGDEVPVFWIDTVDQKTIHIRVVPGTPVHDCH